MKCVIFYVGNGYSENVYDYRSAYSYSVDMRDNRENHEEMIFQPLREMGYELDIALVTNKHEYYEQFLEEYNSLRLNYADYDPSHDNHITSEFYKIKHQNWVGFGSCPTGIRFLKMTSELPEADLYVFLRADTWFKKSLNELHVDTEKLNYLFPETDLKMFEEDRSEFIMKWPYDKMFWDWYRRVNGNVLHIIPKKFIHPFVAYYWLEHLSLYFILKDMKPFITEDNVNLMCGTDICYVTDTYLTENPYYTFNKKIIKNDI